MGAVDGSMALERAHGLCALGTCPPRSFLWPLCTGTCPPHYFPAALWACANPRLDLIVPFIQKPRPFFYPSVYGTIIRAPKGLLL